MAELTLGSLFDGLGGWLIAAKRYGIRPVWASEIEPFPIQVTKKHFPEVLHLGDVSKIDASAVPAVDIVTSGSPCQDLSIAGNRAGLCGSRSGLFYDSVRLFRELREHSNGRTRFYVWENVVGALSSSRGHDFRQVLETLTETSVPMPESGRWAGAGMVRSRRCSIAWRIIDAQHWGVAQRRRRLFLVADFAEPRKRRPEILFESESLCWHPAPFNNSWKSYSRQSADCAGETICIRERCGCEGGVKDSSTEITEATPLPQQTISGYGFDDRAETFCKQRSDNFVPSDVCVTLNSRDYKDHGSALVVERPQTFEVQRRDKFVESDKSATLLSSGRFAHGGDEVMIHQGGIRKLTPIECERLQGLPDNYTLVNEKSSDSKRYKALGNGMAQPCADFIMGVVKRMVEEGDK